MTDIKCDLCPSWVFELPNLPVSSYKYYLYNKDPVAICYHCHNRVTSPFWLKCKGITMEKYLTYQTFK